MKAFIVAMAVLALGVPSLLADCKVRQRVVVRKVEQVAVAIQPAIVATFVPVHVPTYSVGYSPAALDVEVEGLRRRVAELERELAECKAKLGSGPGGPPEPSKGYPAVFRTKCAACHDKAVAKKDGNGFALLDGERLLPIEPIRLARIASKTYTGAMPPKGNKKGIAELSDHEVGEILAWVETYAR